jgi:hypothetical protein
MGPFVHECNIWRALALLIATPLDIGVPFLKHLAESFRERSIEEHLFSRRWMFKSQCAGMQGLSG